MSLRIMGFDRLERSGKSWTKKGAKKAARAVQDELQERRDGRGSYRGIVPMRRGIFRGYKWDVSSYEPRD